MAASAWRTLATMPILILGIACAGGQETSNDVDQNQLADGPGLYARHCASCHGTFGEGDGPVAGVMQVSVPNLRTLSARAGGDFPRETVMRYIDGRDLPAAHGDRLMPVWGDTFVVPDLDTEAGEALARRRIEAITDFVEQLQN